MTFLYYNKIKYIFTIHRIMEKIFIKNKKNLKISVNQNIHKQNKKLVFIMHGFGGSKNQIIIKNLNNIFFKKGFNTISFDTTNSVGESEGNIKEASVKNYYEDLESVINWASNQDWYQEPFSLIGHSLGGFCTAYFSEKYPQKVESLNLISPFISGELSIEAYNRIYLKNPQKIEDLPSLYFEALGYSLFPLINKITSPTIIIAGEKDKIIPMDHANILYNSLPLILKEFHIIKNASHIFYKKEQIEKLSLILNKWIDKF